VSSKTSWRSVNFSSLHIEEWNGEYTVFHPESGKTHFLNQMGFQILVDLHSRPLSAISVDEICQNLMNQFQLQSDTTFSDQVSKTLHRFDELGLIKQVK
jgi:PqqD family protein of HPr-rel-A system